MLQRNEDMSTLEEILKLQRELRGLIDQEDLKWKHRANKHWNKKGTGTPNFFMLALINIEKKNHMK